MRTRTAGGTLVSHPDSFAVQAADGVRRRGPADGGVAATTAALLRGLKAQGLRAAEDLHFGPAAGRGRAGPAADIELAVPLDPQQAAALLVEREGVLSWRFAEPSGTAAARRGPPGTAVFRLDAAAPAAESDTRRGGPLGALVGAIAAPFRAIVVKFAAQALVGAARARLERNVSPGLVDMADPDPRRWAAAKPSAAPAGDGPARALLFLHGCFSSTVGSFGALAATPEGRGFLAAACRHYNRVLGYDHATLGVAPEENALGLRAALGAAGLGPAPTVDIVAFSSGGLRARVFAERPVDRGPAVGRAVFVGAANSGTALAEPENWRQYLDIYTNLAASLGEGLTLLDGGLAGTVLAESIKTLGAFVQAIAANAVDDEAVPGIAALRPTSSLVAALNEAPALDGEGPRYFALGSEFDAGATGPAGATGGLPARLARWMADRAADGIMSRQNDLVVDTEAMVGFGRHAAWLAQSSILGPNPVVHHNNYFLQPEIVRRLEAWLELPPVAEAPQLAPEPSLPIAVPPRKPRRRVEPTAPPPPDALSARTRGARRAAEPARVSCHFAAAMPERPPLDRPARLTVTVSREAVALPPGSVGETAQARVAVDQEVTVEVTARHNCVVIGPDRATVPVPAEAAPETLDFDIRGERAGEAELCVDARQGARRLLRMVLQPEFTDAGRVLRAGTVASTGDVDPPSVGLRIFEESDGPDRPFRLRFLLESRELDLRLDHETPLFDVPQERYVASLYDRLEGSWGSSRDDFSKFMRGLTAFGAELYTRLMPPEIQRALWDNRDRIGSIEVISHEPFIPWEVLHLVQPGGVLPLAGNCFLAELGLTRWISNVGWAPARLRVRKGAARYVIPDYPHPDWRLPGAADEVALLRDAFGATEAAADSLKVLQLLQEPGGFDLLHFACHGVADPSRIWNAGLAMTGRVDAAGAFEQDLLDVAQVQQYARLAHPDGGRPSVFLNACQAGRTGRALSGTGGLADAFIRRGAGLFVGTLWSVGDDTALGFARAFYAALRGGSSLAQATRAARAAAREAAEPTWLAYTVYGHPYARFSFEN